MTTNIPYEIPWKTSCICCDIMANGLSIFKSFDFKFMSEWDTNNNLTNKQQKTPCLLYKIFLF